MFAGGHRENYRTGVSRRSRSATVAGVLQRRLRRGDGGFTMVEMLVAMVIIGIIMAALATFFVTTLSATSRQGANQAATQLADDAIERVRAGKGSAVITGG